MNQTRPTDTQWGGWHAGLKAAGEPEGTPRGKSVIKQPGNGKDSGV